MERKHYFNSNTILEIGKEINPDSFHPSLLYKDVINVNEAIWMTISDHDYKIVKNLCDQGRTDFAYELRGIAAAFAVVSANPRKWRNPICKYLIYRQVKAYKWVTILLEAYINDTPYIWEKANRQEEVSDLLTKVNVAHPVLKYIEDWLDSVVDNHYLGHKAVDDVINYTGENPRAEWRNKIEAVEGEIITMW